MTMTKRDRDNISIHALIGFCQSAYCLQTSDKDGIKRWSESLMEMADALVKKLEHPTKESVK
jgi:hypothetical protein